MDEKMITLSGPMFEPANHHGWHSLYNKTGAHYNHYACEDNIGMDRLRSMFPSGEANEYNVVLFSTSGIHGSYITIEEAEKWLTEDHSKDEDEPEYQGVTFLVIQPRICCLRHGNCIPKTAEDFLFLKSLRQTSWDVLNRIGK